MGCFFFFHKFGRTAYSRKKTNERGRLMGRRQCKKCGHVQYRRGVQHGG